MAKTVIRRGDDPAASRGDSADRVWVCISKTISLGDYEFVRLEYGEGRVVSPGEKPEIVRVPLIQDVVQVVHGLETELRDLLSST